MPGLEVTTGRRRMSTMSARSGRQARAHLTRRALCGHIRMVLASRGLEKLAILVAMSVSEQMPLADVKNRLSEVVDRLEREHGRVVITKHGHPAAVVISVEDLESLEETLDVMGSAPLLDDIREALAELSTADAPVLTKDDTVRLIADR
jgi:antitoxin YefM